MSYRYHATVSKADESEIILDFGQGDIATRLCGVKIPENETTKQYINDMIVGKEVLVEMEGSRIDLFFVHGKHEYNLAHQLVVLGFAFLECSRD